MALHPPHAAQTTREMMETPNDNNEQGREACGRSASAGSTAPGTLHGEDVTWWRRKLERDFTPQRIREEFIPRMVEEERYEFAALGRDVAEFLETCGVR